MTSAGRARRAFLDIPMDEESLALDVIDADGQHYRDADREVRG